MRYLYLLVLLLVSTSQTSAQASSDSAELSVLEKKWQMMRRANLTDFADSPLDRDPFEANNQARQANQDQRDTMRENRLRQRQGLPPVSPPVRKSAPPEFEKRNDAASIVYLYEIKVQNNGTKTISKVVWEYVFFDKNTDQEVGRREFTSEANLKTGKIGNLIGKLFSPPTGSVNVNDAGKKSSDLYVEQINIKSIYYTDGSVWQANSK